MDEKGFHISELQKTGMVYTKAVRARYSSRNRPGRSREWITVMATICADVTELSSALIYKAISGNLQDIWLDDFQPDEHDCYFALSPNGWTSDELGYSWLAGLFEKRWLPKRTAGVPVVAASVAELHAAPYACPTIARLARAGARA